MVICLHTPNSQIFILNQWYLIDAIQYKMHHDQLIQNDLLVFDTILTITCYGCRHIISGVISGTKIYRIE